MPMYDIRCTVCDERGTIFRRMSEYDDLPICSCGFKTERVISAPAIFADIAPYVSPGTGKVVNSRTQQREDLARSGAILSEPGLAQDIRRKRAEIVDKSFAPVASAIDETVARLVSEKKIES